MIVIRPGIFPSGVIAAFSTRRGGVSTPPLGMNLSFRVGDNPESVRRNREIFFGGLGVPLDRLAIPGQVHGDEVSLADHPGDYPGIDALISSTPGLFLCVSIADCVPLLLFDPVRSAVGAVHAGWRGSVSAVARRAVEAMRAAFGTDPRDVLASIGPSASACCYRVGPDVSSRFPPRFLISRNGETFVDLKDSNRSQLLEAGLQAENIDLSPHCTISEPSLFHSHRRDGEKSGRMMGVIGRMA